MDRPTELWMHYQLGFFCDPEKANSETYYHGNDVGMRSRYLPAHRQLLWSWTLLVLSIIWVIVSMYLDITDTSSGNESGLWFQRSGAVLVIASLWVEWNTSRAELGGYTLMAFGVIRPSKRYVRWIMAFSKLGLMCAIAGTAIWAYGDKFVS